MKYTSEKHFFYCAMIALGKISGDEKKPMDLELIFEDLSREEIMAFGRRNLCLGAYSDDERILSDSRDRSTRLMTEKITDGTYMDIQFFNFE